MSNFLHGDPAPRTQPRHPEWIRDDLKSYLDGELSVLHRWRIRKHLARCWTCQGDLEALTQLVEEVKRVDTATPGPELKERIMASLPDTPPALLSQPRRHALPQTLRLGVPRFALGSVAFAASLVGAFALGRVSTGVPPEQTRLKNFSNHADLNRTPLASNQVETNPPAPLRPKSASALHTGQPTKSVATSGTSVVANGSQGYAYHDPFSVSANRLLEQDLKAEAQHKQQEQERSRSLMTSTQQAQFGSGRLEDPIRLSISVSEVASVGDRLQTAVQKLGVIVTPIAGMGEASRSFQEMSADPSIAQNATSSVSVPGHLMLIRVPAARVPDFMRLLTNNPAAAGGADDVAKPTSVSDAGKAGFGPGRGSHLTAPNHYPTLAERESWIDSVPDYKGQLLSQKDSFLTYLVWLHPVK